VRLTGGKLAESRPKGERTIFRRGLLLPQEDGPAVRGDLYLEGGRIAAVCPPDAAPAWRPESATTIDACALWILPGFVQTHLHLCQTLFRGAAEALSLDPWLRTAVWPLEAALDRETTGLAAAAGIHELLSGGTTTILDMGTTRHTEAVLEQAAAFGLRGYFGPALMDLGPPEARPLLRAGREILREIEELAGRWEGACDGRLRLALCPRFVPSVSLALWKELAAEPDFARFPIHTHGSETRSEVAEVVRSTGLTPPAFLSRLEGGHGRVKMAHGVWLSDQDRHDLARSQAAVLHCPGSNLKLGSGLADLLALQRAGIPVGLGADGSACNNRLDAWQEMRLAGYIQGLLHGAETVSAPGLLRLATLDGARAIGLESEVGSLRAGKCADLILLDPHARENPMPAGDRADGGLESPETFLVFAGGRELVRETWVGGQPVYRRGERAAGQDELEQRCRRARQDLADRAGLAIHAETAAPGSKPAAAGPH
jgi:5-methylthioadenosine/S-adenosylhomocysteine deaminase